MKTRQFVKITYAVPNANMRKESGFHSSVIYSYPQVINNPSVTQRKKGITKPFDKDSRIKMFFTGFYEFHNIPRLKKISAFRPLTFLCMVAGSNIC